MREDVVKKIKKRLLEGNEVSANDFDVMKINTELFAGIKFVKKRKVSINWLTWR
jgi:hypothetical protein